jgi:hypothetical protein
MPLGNRLSREARAVQIREAGDMMDSTRHFIDDRGALEMHTLMIVVGGLLLLALCLLIGRLIAGASPSVVALSALYFIPIWLLAAAVNMWVGVSRAGYSVAQEFPIFLVVFAIPAAAAALVWWKFSRA